MEPNRNSETPDAFALRLIELQYRSVRSEIEFFLGKMYDVLRLSLATIPILSGALIALVADQGTWSMATERPILLGIFCLLAPMFLVICIYLANLGVAQYKSVTRAADYLKVHFEDYLFQPIVSELNRTKEQHVYRGAQFDNFLFWENYLSQHEHNTSDERFRNDYDADKHMMFAFLVFLSVGILVVSMICMAAFFLLLSRFQSLSDWSEIQAEILAFETIVFSSFLMFSAALAWSIKSFIAFFATVRNTGVLVSSLKGGKKKT